MEQVVNLKSAISKLDKLSPPNYFIEFMQNGSFEVGVLKLSQGQKDIQDTHQTDEFYFVVSGRGKIRISKSDYNINSGSCIFVPANTKHFFHSNDVELIVLYIFNS